MALWGLWAERPCRDGDGAGGAPLHVGSGVGGPQAEGRACATGGGDGAHQAGLFYLRDVIQDPVFKDSVL